MVNRRYSVLRKLPITFAASARWTLAVAVVALLAFGLRSYAIDSGLPYVDHPDEPNLVTFAARTLQTGDLNPHVFRKPHLYFYLLLPVLWVHYRWGVSSGLYTALDQMQVTTHKFTTIPGFFIWGRALTAVIGALTVVHIYSLGKRVWNPLAGLLAALFVATSPFLIRHAQLVTTDIPSAWMVLLTFTAAVAIAEQGRWRDYLLAGVLAGLATSTKYNAGIVVLAIVAAHGLYWTRQAVTRLFRLVAAGAAALFGFILGSPYTLLAWREFRAGILEQISAYNPADEPPPGAAWDFGEYGRFFWTSGLGMVGCAAVLIGLALLLQRRRKIGLLWLSFAVPYLLLHLSQQLTFMRNLTPLIVLCGLPIGVAGAAAIDWSRRRAPRLAPLALAVVPLVLYAVPTAGAVEQMRYQAQPYSKVLAEKFVRTLPRGQRVAVELNAIPWANDPLVEPVSSLTERTAEWYRANQYRYLVGNYTDHRGDDSEEYQALKASAVVVQTFPGDRGGGLGPFMEVLDLGQHPDALAVVRRPARFGPAVHLLGYEARPGPIRPLISALEGADERVLQSGESLQLNLTWQASEALPMDYALFIHVVDANGAIVTQRDALMRAGEYPTSRWQPGEIVVDRADLPLPPLTPGTYSLRIGIYRMDTGERLPVAEPEPGADPTSIVLTTIQVR